MVVNKKKKGIIAASVAQLDNEVIKVWESSLKTTVEEVFLYYEPKQLSSLELHKKSFLTAWKIFKKAEKEDTIIFWQQLIGLYYGALTKIFHPFRPKSQSLILTFIHKEKKGLIGSFFKLFLKFSLSSKEITKVISHSTSEVDLYKKTFPLVSEKFTFCLLGEGTKSRAYTKKKGYYFSGGASNRDYQTPIKAFGTNGKCLVIACRPESIEGLEIPKNVKAYHNAYGEKFLSLISNSKAAIIAVENNKISSGQLVLLNAMRFGKPIIATKGDCMSDYLDPSYAVLVKPNSVKDLKNAITKLEHDPELLKKMSKCAYLFYNRNFTIEKYAKRISNIILNL